VATGSISITIAVPSIGNSNAGAGSNSLAVALLAQVSQAIGASGATSGNILWPPGANPSVVGTWTYSAAT
jgi:hypothetical protein